MKFHFFDIIGEIKAIVGMNGLIWIYYSTVKLDSEYFTDDQTQVNLFNKHEVLKNFYSKINILFIILFKNFRKLMNFQL